jgi:tetratricopeptide (TPR) repeat protein
MTTRFRSVSTASIALVVGLGMTSAACGKYSYGSLKATKAFKDANALYAAQDFKRAAEKYDEAVAAKPDYTEAYFYLANSYDNLFKPARVGEAENDRFMQRAIEYYKKAAESDPNPKTRKLAMQYLVAAYGPDKLNNPAEAEPIVKKMIEIEPTDPGNYFALSRMYEDAGRYDEAEQALIKAKEVKPNDATVYTAISGFYNRQGEFDKTMEALQQAAQLDPNNPQGYQLIATFYWEKAYKDKRLSPAQTKDYIQRGIQATDKALSLNPNYVEALTYKNILLRMQANTETDRAKQADLIRQADELRNKAVALQKGAKKGD